MFWVANCGASLPPRPETLRFRPLACELCERSQLFAPFSQHVASGIRLGQFSPRFRTGESADAFCGSPFGACAERVWVLRVRRFGGGGDGRARSVGGDLNLARAERATGSRFDDRLPRFDWALLQRIYGVSGFR